MLAEPGTQLKLRFKNKERRGVIMIVKIHKTPEGRKVIAICDDQLIGKTFEEDNKQLDLNSSFYKGDKKEGEEIKGLLKEPCIINVVGVESINLLKRLGLAENSHIIKIKEIPHTQVIVE